MGVFRVRGVLARKSYGSVGVGSEGTYSISASTSGKGLTSIWVGFSGASVMLGFWGRGACYRVALPKGFGAQTQLVEYRRWHQLKAIGS